MHKNAQKCAKMSKVHFFLFKTLSFLYFFFPRVTIVKLLDGLAVFWILNQIYKLFII